MTMVFGEVSFNDRAPTTETLRAKITEICGLPVSIHAPAPGDLDIYDQHAYLSFDVAPEEQLEVFSYRPGAAKKFYNDFMEGYEHLPTAKYSVGLNEAPGTQTVFLRSFVGLEPTLYLVALIALEDLGGKSRDPTTEEDRREYAVRIAPDQLRERREKLHAQFKRAAWLQLLMLPITVPMLLLSFFVMLALTPFRLWKAYQLYQKFDEGLEHREFMRSLGEHLSFFEVKATDFPRLDARVLDEYTHTLEKLGFVRSVDFEVKLDVPCPGQGFARLLFHPTLHCLAEINQIYPDMLPTPPMRCMIASSMSEGWDLATTDRTLEPLNYAWRRPRTLWESFPTKSVVELLESHLARRGEMVERLHVLVKSDLNAEWYFTYQREIHRARRELLAAKSMHDITDEMAQFEKEPISAWLGDFAEQSLKNAITR